MFTPLPIDSLLPELAATLREHPSVVLRAATGAGKTTRVPPALLDAGIAGEGQVLVLEPRRLAARAAARRMAQERGQKLGADVGYHVRFDRQVGPRTRVIVMTPGILLRRLQEDPFLESVRVVIFDEFHERSLDNDLALGLIRLLQTTVRPELKIVVMSATLATDKLSEYLQAGPREGSSQPIPAPTITSEGRLFPVEIAYEPRSLQHPWPVAAATAVERLFVRTPGDILCFLPGMQEIRQTARELASLGRSANVLILPLHGDLSPEEQDRALRQQSQRRIVLATNVAETSVTVEGVTGVVDTGLARIQRFDTSVGMDRLGVAPIARDAADQRAGRAGRTQPGICIRLWSEASHGQREAQTLPEIRRVDLAGAVLHLMALGETEVRAFPWLEPPRQEAIAQALLLLHRLGAVETTSDAPCRITNLGRRMASLPIHPRLARLLIEGERYRQASRAALVAALLAERDPFVRSSAPPRSKRRDGLASDVLERVEALATFEQDGTTSFSIGILHEPAAQFLLRARDQLLRSLRDSAPSRSPPETPTVSADEAVSRSLLAAFPDRVARRREGDPTRGLMVGGIGVQRAAWCGVATSELFLCIDIDAGSREALVRQASALPREWLPPEALTSRIEVFFDADEERMLARKRLYFDDLRIEETDAALPRSEEVAQLLTEAAESRLARVLPEPDSAAGRYLIRLRWLRECMPELGLPAFDEAPLRELLPWACAGCRSFAEVRRADWLGLFQSKLSAAQIQAVEREAPEHLLVPSGSRLALQYEPGRPPVLRVRIQEVFGLQDTPKLAGGRARVLLHLLAPNHRPQQVTDDLASFWKNTYPQVRKDLRARFPKHAWPEDPWTAPPQKGPRRKST